MPAPDDVGAARGAGEIAKPKLESPTATSSSARETSTRRRISPGSAARGRLVVRCRPSRRAFRGRGGPAARRGGDPRERCRRDRPAVPHGRQLGGFADFLERQADGAVRAGHEARPQAPSRARPAAPFLCGTAPPPPGEPPSSAFTSTGRGSARGFRVAESTPTTAVCASCFLAATSTRSPRRTAGPSSHCGICDFRLTCRAAARGGRPPQPRRRAWRRAQAETLMDGGVSYAGTAGGPAAGRRQRAPAARTRRRADERGPPPGRPPAPRPPRGARTCSELLPDEDERGFRASLSRTPATSGSTSRVTRSTRPARGLEYLFGAATETAAGGGTTLSGGGTQTRERGAFERFADWLAARRRRTPACTSTTTRPTSLALTRLMAEQARARPRSTTSCAARSSSTSSASSARPSALGCDELLAQGDRAARPLRPTADLSGGDESRPLG